MTHPVGDQRESSTPRARPSIYDVADRAGVSHMTVSRVLNGHPNIKESTRTRVLQAIADLNYAPSSIARALAAGRVMRIGVLVEGPLQYGPNSTVRALERAARERGYTVSAFSTADGDGTGEADADDAVLNLVTQGVEALCIVAPRVSSLASVRQRAGNLPTLVITSAPGDEPLTAAVDQAAGARMAVQHLIDLGHRDISHLAGPLDWLDARGREQEWRSSLEAARLRVRTPLIGDWTSECGYRLARFEPAFDDVTAVFAANDQMALGVIHGFTQRGLRVPEDISVVGFDDLPDAAHFLPPLTTVRQDFSALGVVALELVIEAIDKGEVTARRTIQPELVVRESTAAPRPL